MTKLKLSNLEIAHIISGSRAEYPKYTTQLINLANQNAQGTRPKVVGQMSELIEVFDGNTIDEWQQWYLTRYPSAISEATQKIYSMIQSLSDAILKIDESLVRKWVEDLVIVKTFTGLRFQRAILQKIAESKNTTYRTATAAEESKGIDGFVGEIAVSIKPKTYLQKQSLSESINTEIIYYEKNKTGIKFFFNF